MDVVVKKGNKTIRKTGFSSTMIALKMEEVLKKHKHLCSDCCSTACQGKRTIESDIIVRGIRTLNRDYVFDCLCYKKIKSDSDTDVFLSKNSSLKNYSFIEYPISDEKVKEYVMKL